MIKKFVLFSLVILTLTGVGCATAPKLTVVNPMGEPMPEPHYVMTDTDRHVRVTFYFKAVGWIEDVDKSKQPNPVYLARNGNYSFSTKKYDRVMLIMKVFNPRNLQYNVFSHQAVSFKGGGNMSHLSQVAASDLTFRSHEFYLPYGEKTKSVTVSFEVQSSDGRTLVRTGKFNYRIVN